MIKLPQLPQLRPRERLLAVGTGVVLVIVVMDRFVLSPWLRHAKAVRQEIHEMEQALQSYQRLLGRKQPVLQEFARYERYLQPPIANDLQMAALLKEVQELAGQSHVEISEIKPLAVEADEVAKRYPLEVRFQCTLDQWVDFVFRIDSSPSLFEVIRAGLSRQEDRPDRLNGYLRVMSAVGNAQMANANINGRGIGGTTAK